MRTNRTASRPPRRVPPRSGWTDPNPAPARPWYEHPAVLALGCVFVATLLRAWRIDGALPEGPLAAAPVRDAWAMIDPITGGLARDAAASATLASALHLWVQRLLYLAGSAYGVWSRPADFAVAATLDPSPMFVAARAAEIACDAVAVLIAYRLGERMARGAGIYAGLLAAVAPVSIAAARSVDAVAPMTALALASIDRLLVWREDGGRTPLLASTALAGLAVSASPLGLALLAPIAWAAWERNGFRGLRAAFGGVTFGALVFAIASPKAMLDPHAFAAVWAERHHASIPALPLAFGTLLALTMSLGPAGVALAIFGACALPASTRGRHPGATLVIGAAAFAVLGAVTMPGNATALSASAMMMAPIATIAAMTLYERFRTRIGPRLRGMCVAFVLLPPAFAGLHAAWIGADRTTAIARRWCERHVGSSLVVVQDVGPQWLPTRADLEGEIAPAVLAAASLDWRARHQGRKPYHAVDVPPDHGGRVPNDIVLEGRTLAQRDAFPDGEAAGDARYEPALFAGADVVIATSEARGRAASDPERHPNAARLFSLLDHTAQRIVTFHPHGAVIGPEVRAYFIGEAARGALAGEGLEATWWTRHVSAEYRAAAQTALGAPPSEAGRPRDHYGRPSAWVESLAPVYHQRYAGFVQALAAEYAACDRGALARRMAAATLLVTPDDVDACRLASLSERRVADWPRARQIVERTLEARRGRPLDPGLAVEHARTLLATGDREAARARLSAIAQSPVGDSATSEARELLSSVP
jgi:hypothetical protein